MFNFTNGQQLVKIVFVIWMSHSIKALTFDLQNNDPGKLNEVIFLEILDFIKIEFQI